MPLKQLSTESFATDASESGTPPSERKADNSVVDGVGDSSADKNSSADKTAVAQAFGQAATAYDHVAVVQKQVARRLSEAMGSARTYSHILDVGCGTGLLSLEMARVHHVNRMLALDIAPAMLQGLQQQWHSRTREVGELPVPQFVCADAERLPIASNHCDVIVSSFALQWCHDIHAAFREIIRVLKPGCSAYVALPCAGTLHELAAAWRVADPEGIHVNAFHSLSALVDVAEVCGAAEVVAETWQYQEFFPDVASIARSLKQMGANTVTAGRAPQATSKQRYRRLQSAYEAYRGQHGLPLTWQVGVLQLTKTL